MPTLTLSNFKQDALVKQVIIDLGTGMCVVEDQYLEAKRLATTFDFVHPLLVQSTLVLSEGLYVYEYDDFEGLLDAAKFIYATLIHVDNSCDCHFKIRPSRHFVRLRQHYQIPFSIDYKRQAREEIAIEQFNAMVSHFNGFDFHYQDTLVLDQIITLNSLPSTVNGDLLYETNKDIIQFCKQPDDFTKYEIRYINRFIGLGVFARQDILKDEWITHYCGLKNRIDESGGAYAFGYKGDVFNLRIEAMNYGNISRFINHAPKNTHESPNKVPRLALTSNVVAQAHGLYGNDVIVYRAKRAILKGEQLFINYGESYFPNNIDMFYLTQHGEMVHSDSKKIQESRQQRHLSLQWMSQHGAKEAQWLLMRKPLMIFAATLLFAWFLRRS